jgi:hypothetical protein
MAGNSGVNVLLQVALYSSFTYGVIWGIADHWVFRWNYGGGGNFTMPTGWSAVVLSLSVTLPLAFVPLFYGYISGIRVVILPQHWKAMALVIVLGAIGHLIMYGTNANGIRQWLSPNGEYPSWQSGLLLEAIYTLIYFSAIVLPYRLVVSPNSSLTDLLCFRLLLPGLAFFLAITLFIAFMYPGSLNDRGWVLLRGIASGLVMMFCFCAGMFL